LAKVEYVGEIELADAANNGNVRELKMLNEPRFWLDKTLRFSAFRIHVGAHCLNQPTRIVPAGRYLLIPGASHTSTQAAPTSCARRKGLMRTALFAEPAAGNTSS
jgi:hypothetical protein